MKYFVAYLIAGGVFLIVDLLWLGVVAKTWYAERLGPLMRSEILVAPAILFYLIYLGGIVLFAVVPAYQTGSWRTALLFGALFGFFAYATYDLTNLATLRDWPLSVTIVDLTWGTMLTAATATIAFLVSQRLFPSVP